MIKSFADKATQAFFEEGKIKKGAGWASVAEVAEMKLDVLDAAEELETLRSPPGNHLEKLVGDRKGQHSIRINRTWRICFTWNGTDAEDVEITNYHKG